MDDIDELFDQLYSVLQAHSSASSAEPSSGTKPATETSSETETSAAHELSPAPDLSFAVEPSSATEPSSAHELSPATELSFAPKVSSVPQSLPAHELSPAPVFSSAAEPSPAPELSLAHELSSPNELSPALALTFAGEPSSAPELSSAPDLSSAHELSPTIEVQSAPKLSSAPESLPAHELSPVPVFSPAAEPSPAPVASSTAEPAPVFSPAPEPSSAPKLSSASEPSTAPDPAPPKTTRNQSQNTDSPTLFFVVENDIRYIVECDPKFKPFNNAKEKCDEIKKILNKMESLGMQDSQLYTHMLGLHSMYEKNYELYQLVKPKMDEHQRLLEQMRCVIREVNEEEKKEKERSSLKSKDQMEKEIFERRKVHQRIIVMHPRPSALAISEAVQSEIESDIAEDYEHKHKQRQELQIQQQEDLIKAKIIENIERYQQNLLTDDKQNEIFADETDFGLINPVKVTISEQPSLLANGDLKDYQLRGLEWLVFLYNNNLNGILADEMGLGKTIQVIALIAYIIERNRVCEPFLIVVTLSTLSNWQNEFKKWLPSLVCIVYRGNIDSRRELRMRMSKEWFHVVITTYDYIINDRLGLGKLHWEYMIIDEGHCLKNPKSQLQRTLNKYYSASHRLLLTGTPLQNKLADLWSQLHFLHPHIFDCCKTFMKWFNEPFAMTGEQVAINDARDNLTLRRLHSVLRPFLLRRLKKDVAVHLPAKKEFIIKCGMSALQRIYYNHYQTTDKILIDPSKSIHNTKSTSFPTKPDGVFMNNHNKQLAKLCNHPFLFKNTIEEQFLAHLGVHRDDCGALLFRVAGKFERLDSILLKLQASKHRVLLFCTSARCLEIMEDYLDWRDFKYLKLDGNVKLRERTELISQFNEPNSQYFLFILSTRAGGLGLNLQSADTVILFDQDWNPHRDQQATDRAHRIGQTKEVRVLRFVTVDSIEERVLATGHLKLHMDSKVIQAGMFDQKSTDTERQRFLQNISQMDVEAEEQEMIDESSVSQNYQINQMLARNEEELKLFEIIDQDLEIEAEKMRKPRLLSIEELPDWLTNKEKAADQVVPETQDESCDEETKVLRRTRTRRQCRERQRSQYYTTLSNTTPEMPSPMKTRSKRIKSNQSDVDSAASNADNSEVEDTTARRARRGRQVHTLQTDIRGQTDSGDGASNTENSEAEDTATKRTGRGRQVKKTQRKSRGQSESGGTTSNTENSEAEDPPTKRTGRGRQVKTSQRKGRGQSESGGTTSNTENSEVENTPAKKTRRGRQVKTSQRKGRGQSESGGTTSNTENSEAEDTATKKRGRGRQVKTSQRKGRGQSESGGTTSNTDNSEVENTATKRRGRGRQVKKTQKKSRGQRESGGTTSNTENSEAEATATKRTGRGRQVKKTQRKGRGQSESGGTTSNTDNSEVENTPAKKTRRGRQVKTSQRKSRGQSESGGTTSNTDNSEVENTPAKKTRRGRQVKTSQRNSRGQSDVETAAQSQSGSESENIPTKRTRSGRQVKPSRRYSDCYSDSGMGAQNQTNPGNNKRYKKRTRRLREGQELAPVRRSLRIAAYTSMSERSGDDDDL